MRGEWVRQRIWLKLWFSSVYSILIMLLFPISVYYLGVIFANDIESFTSLVYEKVALIWLVFILRWCFSIDFDTNFHQQLVTYPLPRWRIIMERIYFSVIIFCMSLVFMTLAFKLFAVDVSWKSFVFSIPLYAAITGVFALLTVLGNHSLGGLLGGLIFWMIAVSNGEVLVDLNPVILEFPNVYNAVVGNGFAETNINWMLYNRLFYILFGLVFIMLAVVRFNRKSF